MALHRRHLLIGASATLAACSPAAKPKSASGRTAIRFATDWRAEAEHGGFYQALATGEYARRGLDVTVIPGGPGVNVPQLLASGAVDLGIGSNSFGVMNLAAEQVPVTAVMAAMQKDPQVLIAHPNSGIASLGDLKGHPILLSDSAVTSFWPWLKAKYGLSDDQVRKYTYSAAPFLSDARAVQEGYVTSEPYTIQKALGKPPLVFLLADQGYPGYAGMVLAPTKLIGTNPQAVKAFVEGSVAGWKSYIDGDPKPADALILKDNSEMTADVLAQARAKLKQYAIVQAPGVPIGTMTDARWNTFFDMASGLGVYPKTLDWKSAYTLAFL